MNKNDWRYIYSNVELKKKSYKFVNRPSILSEPKIYLLKYVRKKNIRTQSAYLTNLTCSY
jgi:hypothetical protein